MPMFSFVGDVYIKCPVWIEAETAEKAIEKARAHKTFDQYDLSERPYWFVWNEDTVEDEDGKELDFK